MSRRKFIRNLFPGLLAAPMIAKEVVAQEKLQKDQDIFDKVGINNSITLNIIEDLDEGKYIEHNMKIFNSTGIYERVRRDPDGTQWYRKVGE